MDANLSTIGEALTWASSFLRQTPAGSSRSSRSSRAEAETLLLWVLGWERIHLLTALSDPLSDAALVDFRAAVERRAAGEPLQYIVGTAGFYGRLFNVRPGCLIPRPETEVLAEQAIDWVRRHRPAAHIVDFGCGSGALAVTLALECEEASVTAIDRSIEAARIAMENADLLIARVDVQVADGFEWLAAHQVNVLVSNPPYIPSADVDALDSEVREYEPHAALDGGADGLDYYRRFSQLGNCVFLPGPAALFLEVGFDQADEVIRMFAVDDAVRWPGWRFWTTPDLRGIRRIVAGERLDA